MTKLLPDLISNYLKYMENIESASILTLKAYKIDLMQAYQDSPYYKTANLHPIKSDDELWFITRSVLQVWSHLSLSSRNRKVATLKSFFNWLYQERLIDKNYSHRLVCPKRAKKIPHFLSLDEITSVLSYFHKKDKTAHEEFELILFLLLYGGGLRISEACGLKWNHIHFTQRRLLIHGKGNKERIVILPDFCMQYLERYYNKSNIKTEYIFGEQPLNPRTGYNMIRSCGSKANLMNPLHPHALRHSFATHLLASGANLRTLQKFLGHESLQATEKYTHLNIDSLARTIDLKHPLSKLKV